MVGFVCGFSGGEFVLNLIQIALTDCHSERSEETLESADSRIQEISRFARNDNQFRNSINYDTRCYNLLNSGNCFGNCYFSIHKIHYSEQKQNA